MKKSGLEQLGRRERQIMEIIYRRGRANAAEVLADLPDPPTYTAVRGMLRLLESKGHLRHEQDGPRYVYFPTANPDRVSKSACYSDRGGAHATATEESAYFLTANGDG